MKVVVALLAAAVLGASGCGPSPGPAAVTSGQDAQASAPSSAGTAGGGGASGAARPGPSPTLPTYMQGTAPAPVDTSLSNSCVMPGGTELLTVKTVAGYSISFDTQYSDGGDGHKYGGWGYVTVPPNGVYQSGWTVLRSAPPGKVIVWIAISGRSGDKGYSAFRQPTFTVSGVCSPP